MVPEVDRGVVVGEVKGRAQLERKTADIQLVRVCDQVRWAGCRVVQREVVRGLFSWFDDMEV